VKTDFITTATYSIHYRKEVIATFMSFFAEEGNSWAYERVADVWPSEEFEGESPDDDGGGDDDVRRWIMVIDISL
jgi:hypothetical protein